MKLLANGIDMRHEIEGSGEEVVLIHSLGLDSKMWWQQVPALSKQFRVLRYDVRGHGETDKPLGPYSLELFTADLDALLRELAIRRVHLIGISMGGMIALQFAATFPRLVRSVTLAGTPSEFPPETRRLFEERAKLVETQGMAAIVDGLIGRWFTSAYIASEKAIVDRIREALLENDPRCYAEGCRAVARLNLSTELHKLKMPMLLIAGAADPVTPLEAVEKIHHHVAGSQLVVIPGAAHMCSIERAEGFNSAVLEFLTK